MEVFRKLKIEKNEPRRTPRTLRKTLFTTEFTEDTEKNGFLGWPSAKNEGIGSVISVPLTSASEWVVKKNAPYPVIPRSPLPCHSEERSDEESL